ncbi:MAG: hypothetical protein ABF436_08345 [Acetobacter okinawensis]
MTTVLAEGFGPLRLNAHVGGLGGGGWGAALPDGGNTMGEGTAA